MLDDLLVKINVDMSPLLAAAPKIDTNLNRMHTAINQINASPIVVVPTSAVNALETVEMAAHAVSSSMEAAAFSTTLATRSLNTLATVAGAAGSTFSALDRSATIATGSLTTVATAAGIVAPALRQAASVTGSVAMAMRSVATGARAFASTVGRLTTNLKVVTGAFLHVIHSVHAVQIGVDLLSTAFSILMVPIRMIGAAAVVVFRGFAMLLTAPIRAAGMLVNGIRAIASAAWTLVSPMLSIAVTVFKVWFIFKGWISTLKILGQWLSMLPPKFRLIVGGLLVLGATGKVGAFALNMLAKGAKVAMTAFQLLSLPVLALTNPMAALRSAATLLGRSLLAAGNMAARAARSFYAMGASVGSAVGNVAGMIGGKLLSVIKSGVTGFALLGGAAAAWGIKMATKAETATVVFGTMLKSMTAGKALMNELEGWSGAPLFDPEAIQLSGTLLFKAGVAADKITGKLDQLGNIAAATKTPLDDLAKIYQQGMNQGAFQQDKINQLSDRGIAIYEGLAHATGVSGAALKEMIRDGKIGPEQMNAAIEHLTTGTGIYAGAMTNLSQTTGGMWSAMMNKAGLAAREFGINILQAIDAKGLMGQATAFFSNLKSQMANAMPAFTAMATVVQAAFGAVWEIATVTFSAITESLGLTSGNWMTTFMEWSAIATWAFQQWPDIATLAFVNVGLALVRFGSETHAVFSDAANVVMTVFANIGRNIKMAMKEIWDFIASGGRNSMRFAFEPLLDGFKESARQIGPIEAGLAATSERLGESLGSSLAANIDANMQMLEKFKIDQAAYVAPTLDGAHGPGDTSTATDTAAASDKKRSNFAVDSLDRGTEAALKAMYASARNEKDRTQELALTESKKQTRLLTELTKMRGATVQGAV